MGDQHGPRLARRRPGRRRRSKVVDGADAGWPRCHAGDLPDPEFGGEGACDGVVVPAATFRGAHRSPGSRGMGGPSRGCPPRLVEPIRQGRVRAVVAALGRRPGRRGRAVRDRASCPKAPRTRSAAQPAWPAGRTEHLYVSDDKGGYIYPHRPTVALSEHLGRTIRGRDRGRSRRTWSEPWTNIRSRTWSSRSLRHQREGPPGVRRDCRANPGAPGQRDDYCRSRSASLLSSPTATRPLRGRTGHRPPKASSAATAGSAIQGTCARTVSPQRSSPGIAGLSPLARAYRRSAARETLHLLAEGARCSMSAKGCCPRHRRRTPSNPRGPEPHDEDHIGDSNGLRGNEFRVHRVDVVDHEAAGSNPVAIVLVLAVQVEPRPGGRRTPGHRR